MKKVLYLFLVLFLTGCLYGNNKALHLPSNVLKKSVLKIVRNGKMTEKIVYTIRKDNINNRVQNSEKIQYYAYSNGQEFNSKSNIMIKFKNNKKVDLSQIEVKYALKLIRKMNSGDYLFKNTEGDTLEKIGKISQDRDLDIKKISPDLKLNMKAF